VHLLGLLNLSHFVATAGYGAVFVLCVLQSCCVPTSSELTLGFAGVLAAQGRLSLAGVVAVGVLGEVAGAYVAWAVGRFAGRAVVDRFGRYILLTHRDLDRAEAWYDRHQRFGVLGSRLLPVIRGFVALPAGIAEVPLVRFGILTAAGSLLWDGAWAGIGYGVGGHWHTIASGFGDAGYVLAALFAAAIALAAYRRYRSYKRATSQDAPEDEEPRSPTGGPATGPVRWLASSSGGPPESRLPFSAAPATDRWVAGSSGRPARPVGRRDFPGSPVAAWDAAVLHGRRGPGPDAELLGDVGEGSVEANGRLTAMTGAILLVLLATEGVTILHVGPLLTVHVVIGMVLVPVTLLKIGSTTWRFARYYLGSPEYRRKGPPPAALRLLGPFVVVTTVAVVGSGIALLLASNALRSELLLIHKVTFVLWFAAMAVHVLGHLLDLARLAPRDFYWRTSRQIGGAGARQWAIVSAVCLGILLAVVVAPKVGPWLAGGQPAHKIVGVHAPATDGGNKHRGR
jgi:membrane protein DedA with SNARE-associated domain